MGAFRHQNPAGSRFSDGSRGVFYAAKGRTTAISETRYHAKLFSLATKERAWYLQSRLCHVRVQGEVLNLHGYAKNIPTFSLRAAMAHRRPWVKRSDLA